MAGVHAGLVAFTYVRSKLLKHAARFLALSILCGWVVFKGLTPPGSFKEALMWFGVPFFGLLGLIPLFRMFDRRFILTISPAGIRDVRISPSFMPWTDIKKVGLRRIRNQEFLMLELEPAIEQRLIKSRLAVFFKHLNALVGMPGYSVSAAALDGSFEEVLSAVYLFGAASRLERAENIVE
jgi:hypothetical protein